MHPTRPIIISARTVFFLETWFAVVLAYLMLWLSFEGNLDRLSDRGLGRIELGVLVTATLLTGIATLILDLICGLLIIPMAALLGVDPREIDPLYVLIGILAALVLFVFVRRSRDHEL